MKAILFDDFEVEIDPSIWHVGPSWKQGKPDSAYLLKFFHERLSEMQNPIMLDIGANTGNFSLLAKFHLGSIVYAFEPNPPIYEILVRDIQRNGLEDQVTAFPFALSNAEGEATLWVPRKQRRVASATLGSSPRRPGCLKVKVPTRKLDQFASTWPRVDIMKIDVEGAEILVLEGGKQTIQKYMPKLLIEWFKPTLAQFGRKPKHLERMLKNLGYNRFQPIGSHDMWVTQIK